MFLYNGWPYVQGVFIMLMPSERAQAIKILTNATMQCAEYRYNVTEYVQNLLTHGHKGFSAYSDLELLRAIQTMAKKTQSHEVVSFISTIAADKFILE